MSAQKLSLTLPENPGIDEAALAAIHAEPHQKAEMILEAVLAAPEGSAIQALRGFLETVVSGEMPGPERAHMESGHARAISLLYTLGTDAKGGRNTLHLIAELLSRNLSTLQKPADISAFLNTLLEEVGAFLELHRDRFAQLFVAPDAPPEKPAAPAKPATPTLRPELATLPPQAGISHTLVAGNIGALTEAIRGADTKTAAACVRDLLWALRLVAPLQATEETAAGERAAIDLHQKAFQAPPRGAERAIAELLAQELQEYHRYLLDQQAKKVEAQTGIDERGVYRVLQVRFDRLKAMIVSQPAHFLPLMDEGKPHV